MKTSILSLAVAFLGAAAKCTADGSPLTVKTSTGSFTGLVEPEFPNTRQFRSIPFAEPPVGSRRWLPPQSLSPSEEHRWSTKYPPSCAQFVSGVPGFWNSDLTKGNLIYNGAQNDTSGLIGEASSEDCLHLAVWTPKGDIPVEGLPVLFFMTGGGWMQGGVELPWQIPTTWVDRSGDFVVVAINYRLGIFGFPAARGLKDGERNLGILDQRVALEWTRDNIAAFGGDPNRIMHWGRSAGSVSADIHSYAYPEDPIAQSYYPESGTVFSVQVPVESDYFSNFTFVAENVGCGSPCGLGVECSSEEEEAAAELDCMRQVATNQLTNFVGQYGDRGETPALRFSISSDEQVIFSDYHAKSAAGEFAHLPMLLSFTANEFSTLVNIPAENITEGPWNEPVLEGSISFGACGTYNSTAYRNAEDVPVFRMQYAAEFPNLNVYSWLGAYHNAETPLIFGTYDQLTHIANWTEEQIEMSHSMQDHIMAFAKDPYNGPQELGWEPQDTSAPGGGSVLRYGGRSGKLLEYVDGLEIDAVCLGMGEYDQFP